jgi:TPR repeat protein
LLNLSSLPPFSDVLAAVTLYKSFVEVDAAKASIYLERAAEMGHEESMYLLAKELQASGKEEDGARAVELYRRIWRDHSSVAAVRALGNIFLDGQPGVPADKRAGLKLIICSFFLCFFFFFFFFVFFFFVFTLSFSHFVSWFFFCSCSVLHSGCSMGRLRLACSNLGCCFELGVGINKDVAKAVEWYRRAALEHNDAEAMKVLTRVYMSLDDEENALLFAKRLAEERSSSPNSSSNVWSEE